MSKKYSKSELEKLSNDYFSNNPDVANVFCTTDGQIFQEENRAELHAKSEDKMAVFGFTNPKEAEVEKSTPKGKKEASKKEAPKKEEPKKEASKKDEPVKEESDEEEKGNEDESK